VGTHFSRRAQAVLSAAQAEAKAGGFPAPTAFHILSAIVKESGSSAVALLRRMGMDLEKLTAECTALILDLEESPAARQEWSDVLDSALAEAKRLGHESAGTSHLILGILKHGKNEAAACLRRFGAELLPLRQLVMATGGEKQRAQSMISCHRPSLLAVAEDWENPAAASEALVSRPQLERAVFECLARAESPRVILYGRRGAGRHCLLRCVSRRAARDSCTLFDSPLRALRLDLLRLLGWRWQRANQKVADLLRDLRTPGPFLLVLDNLDVFADSSYEEEARFWFRLVVGSTAFPLAVIAEAKTYELFIRRDEFLKSRLRPIEVPSPCGDEALRILHVVKEKLEAFHGVRIEEEAVDQAFVLAAEADTETAFQAAWNVLDRASAAARLRGIDEGPLGISQLEERLEELARLKQEAVRAQDYKKAAKIRDEENRLREEKLRIALREDADFDRSVDAASVAKFFEPLVHGGAGLEWNGG